MLDNWKDIPKEFRGKEKRQNLERAFAAMGLYGSLLLETVTGVIAALTGVACKKNPEHLGFRQYTDYVATGNIIKQECGDAKPTGRDIFAAIGYLSGEYGGTDNAQASEIGFKVALEYYLGNCSAGVVSDEEKQRWKAERIAKVKAEKAKLKKKQDRAKAFAKEVYANQLPTAESAAIYSNYIAKGRGISSFVDMELSEHIFVSKIKYSYEGDPRDGEVMTAIVFPLTKLIGDTYKILGLHAVYLDESNGVYNKADVVLPKKDLPSWCESAGAACNMYVAGHKTLVIGEGNETVASYYGACKSIYANFKADFKFTNTAVRLGNADVTGYEDVLVLVDRDRSGTGLFTARKFQHYWESKGVNVQLVMPPSLQVPIFVVVNESAEGVNLEQSLEVANYWLQVDKVFEEQLTADGKEYKSRYKPILVLPNGFDGECDFPNVMTSEEHKALRKSKAIPKGVDWDDVISHGPNYITEIQNMVMQYNRKQKELASKAA